MLAWVCAYVKDRVLYSVTTTKIVIRNETENKRKNDKLINFSSVQWPWWPFALCACGVLAAAFLEVIILWAY